MSEKIDSGEYTTILNDAKNPFMVDGVSYTNEIDMRSRIINWEDFIKDFRDTNEALPQDFTSTRFQIYLIDRLLDKTFGFYPKRNERGREVRAGDIDDTYIDISIEIDKILSATQSSNRNLTQAEKQKLEELTQVLNEQRKARVAENAKTALLFFKTPEAQKEYFELQEKMEKENIDKKIRQFDYENYIEYIGEREELEYSLSGVYTTADIDTRDRILSVQDFSENLAELMKDIPENQRKSVFETIFARMIGRVYGIGKNDLQNNQELSYHFNNVKSSINDSVFGDKSVELKKINASLIFMNGYHKQVAEQNKKSAAISFKDEGTKKMYDLIVALTKSEVSLSGMQQHIRTLIEIHNDFEKKDSSKRQDSNKKNDDGLPKEK